MLTTLPPMPKKMTHQAIDPKTGTKRLAAVVLAPENFSIVLPDTFEVRDGKKVRVSEGGAIRGAKGDGILRLSDGTIFAIKAKTLGETWAAIP